VIKLSRARFIDQHDLDFVKEFCHTHAPSWPVTGWRTAAERLYQRQDEEPDAPHRHTYRRAQRRQRPT
jgi:hypothetical protein